MCACARVCTRVHHRHSRFTHSIVISTTHPSTTTTTTLLSLLRCHSTIRICPAYPRGNLVICFLSISFFPARPFDCLPCAMHWHCDIILRFVPLAIQMEADMFRWIFGYCCVIIEESLSLSHICRHTHTAIHSHIFGQSFTFPFLFYRFQWIFFPHFYSASIFWCIPYPTHAHHEVIVCLSAFTLMLTEWWSATIYKFNDNRLFTRKAKASQAKPWLRVFSSYWSAFFRHSIFRFCRIVFNFGTKPNFAIILHHKMLLDNRFRQRICTWNESLATRYK